MFSRQTWVTMKLNAAEDEGYSRRKCVEEQVVVAGAVEQFGSKLLEAGGVVVSDGGVSAEAGAWYSGRRGTKQRN
ncbi:hypothetical protein E2C01_046209 [Portunus trituberculatus]|uniref:Uncharacterized protein n=1 Tax=Portunus trituberculatus TaxID=210409 RepID=A0A5B7G707_PORTR|nr:hypothetical protein [Portunus trituberculatus]